MVQLFSEYPDYLVAKAIDPTNGLPAMSEFPPSLKAAKDFFESFRKEDQERAWEQWKRDRQIEHRRQQLAAREEPPRDPEMVARVNAGFAELVAKLKTPDTRPCPFPAEPRTCHADELPNLSERAQAIVRDQTKTKT